jgi:HEAT repeat protein
MVPATPRFFHDARTRTELTGKWPAQPLSLFRDLSTSLVIVLAMWAGTGAAETIQLEPWQKQGLAFALTDPDEATQLAVLKLSEFDPERIRSLFIDGMEQFSPEQRKRVAPAIERLLRSAKDADVATVALALGRLGAQESIAALEALRASNKRNEAVANVALLQLAKKNKVIPVLEHLLDSHIAVDAAVALGELGEKDKAIPTLEANLYHYNGEVDFEAAIALGRLGVKEKGVPALKKLLGKNKVDDVYKAAMALAELGERDSAIERLEKLLGSNNTQEVAKACEAIGSLKATRSIGALKRLLGSEDVSNVINAALALGRVEAKSDAIPALNDALRRSVDPQKVLAVAEALGQLGAKESAAVALEKLLAHGAPEYIVVGAARALARMGATRSIPALENVLVTSEYNDAIIAAAAALARLGAKQSTPKLAAYLESRNPEILGAVAGALEQLGELDLKRKGITSLEKLLDNRDEDDDDVIEAVHALSELKEKQSVGKLETLLHHRDVKVTRHAAATLAGLGVVRFNNMLPLLAKAYGYENQAGELRAYAHFLAGGNPDHEIAIGCLGRNREESCRLGTLSAANAKAHLRVFRQAWEGSKNEDLRGDVARRVARLAGTSVGNSAGKEELEFFSTQLEKEPRYATEYKAVTQNLYKQGHPAWFRLISHTWGIHLLLWVSLIFAYPRSTTVQSLFFWNPWVRKIVGFAYVGVLLTHVPFLRNRLLAPFRDALLGDADLKSFDPQSYFSDCSVYEKPNGKSEPIDTGIPEIRGQIILEGESGLGKTMLLRRFAYRAKRPTVYLVAHRCGTGVLEAIQSKLFGYAQDSSFLQSLIHRGALDVCIDGLNEVSPDTRAQVGVFLDRYVRCNVIVATQPMEWMPPKTARVYRLEPLDEIKIKDFLVTRKRDLPENVRVNGVDYEIACEQYLARALSPLAGESKQATLRMLSNPWDLTVVSLMLAQGEEPNFSRLREQQYQIMARDYADRNVGRAFPLQRFSGSCYQMRLADVATIDEKAFQIELLCMERYKMVVRRQYNDTNQKLVTEWLFRHDRVLEYFIVQTFLDDGKERVHQHVRDGRFRGVYLLLATLMPLDDARALLKILYLHAAETQDHSVVDSFVRLVHEREMAPLS